MNQRDYDPEEPPRSALGADDVFFEPKRTNSSSAGEVEMTQPVKRGPGRPPGPPKVQVDPSVEYRKAMPKEYEDAMQRLLFQINLHRSITMNQDRVVECLQRIDAYVAAHADGNGERSDAEVQRNINAAFWTHIVNDHTQGRRNAKAGRPTKEVQEQRRLMREQAIARGDLLDPEDQDE